MVKDADIFFTILFGIPFWVLDDHEPIIVALFLPIVSRRERRGQWNIRGRKLDTGTVRELDIEFNRKWEGLRPPLLVGELQKMSEESSKTSGGILQKFLHKMRAINSMSNDVVRRLLQISR